jgi:putative MATE family efflux protein
MLAFYWVNHCIDPQLNSIPYQVFNQGDIMRYKTAITSDLKRIFELSWPVMLGMVLQSLLGTVDMMFISMLGTSELAAASISNSASGVIFVISSLASAGAIALVSRNHGEGNLEGVRKYSSESLLLSLIIGGATGLICFFNTIPLIRLMFNPDNQITQMAGEYLSVIFLGTIFVFANSALRSILQALGDTRTPLYIFGLSNLVNLVLDPVFMFTFRMGIAGAAWATVISTIFSFAAINMVLVKKVYNSSLGEFIRSLGLDLKGSIRILKIGGWACIQQVARPITGMFMMGLVYQVGGKDGTAAFGAGGQLFNYTFIFLVGLSTAISIMVGHCLGRKDTDGCDSIIREGIKLAAINMAVFAIPYFIFPGVIIRIFSDDPNVVRIGAEYLRIVYIGVIFVIFPTIYGGVFQGAGDTFPPMISSLAANVVFKLPAAYILAIALGMGTNGVWAAVALSVVMEAAIIIFYFRKNKWKERVI